MVGAFLVNIPSPHQPYIRDSFTFNAQDPELCASPSLADKIKQTQEAVVNETRQAKDASRYARLPEVL